MFKKYYNFFFCNQDFKRGISVEFMQNYNIYYLINFKIMVKTTIQSFLKSSYNKHQEINH